MKGIQGFRTSALGGFRAGVALSSLALSLCVSVSAFAQDGHDAKKGDSSDIVVTGTLIRGTAAVGSQTLAVGSQQILEQGAISTNEVLALVPQIANTFNGRPENEPRGIHSGVSINKPNLRNLPAFNSGSGGTTLVLMDGFRITPVGVNQSTIDVDVIPAAVLEGIDVITDGGSSLYGADAVAGVINFRTKKKFDGLKIDANYGLGTTIKDFREWDASITAGTSWSTGNAYISAGHSHRDGILNGETSWVSSKVYSPAGVASETGTQCFTPVGSQIRYLHYGAADNQWTANPLAPGAGPVAIGAPCDQVSTASYLPKQTRTNVFASLSQTVSDNIDLRVTAYWTKRDTANSIYPLGYTTPAATPVFPAGQPVGTIYSVLGGVGFSFGANSAYVSKPERIGFETWGITPELTVDLGHDWKLRNTLHFGHSSNYQHLPAVNNVLAQSYIDSGALNPVNVAAASASVITDVLNFENAQETKQQLFDFRTIADGPIFALPGGDAKLAVGIEYQDPSVKTRLSSGLTSLLSTLPWKSAERNSKSVFAELSLPLASFLDVAGSVRYDNYSDFGSTTNPNIGVALKPTSWLKVFGHWNTSFNAPTPLDNLAVSTGRYVCGIYSPTNGPYDPLHKWNGTGTCAFVAEGATPGLMPQTAKSWAVGFEVTPIDGLRFGGEFYSIDFSHVLGAVDPQNLTNYVTHPEAFIYNPSSTLFASYLASFANGSALATQISSSQVAIFVDHRTTNLAHAKLEGVDFHLYYDTETSFGHVAFGINGTKGTKSTLDNGATITDGLGVGTPKLTASTFVAWSKGGISTRVTVNYSGKFHDSGVDYLNQVETVDPFIQTNLFLGYNFGKSGGALDGTSFRLTVDNLFEAKPQPIMRGSGSVLTYNNWTLGRVIKLGVSKQF